MEAQPSPIKATPGRRRHPRGGKPAALKAYASENDAASYAASSHQQHHRAPQTPKKIVSASPAPNNQPGSKQRNARNNKPKAKNDPSSPNYHLSNNHSQSPSGASPPKAISSTPFAGATFHASPAPADLPIPSFLKSSSDSPLVRQPRGFISQPSPPATDSELPTSYRPVSARQHRESPLDFMFRAHREEKARQEQDGTPVAAPPLVGPMSPPRHLDAPLTPTASDLARHRRMHDRHTFNGTEIYELDGTGGHSLGPPFSTPYQDRTQSSRHNASNPSSVPGNPLPAPASNAPSEDPTEALKRFLFTPQSAASTAPSSVSNHSQPPSRRAEVYSNSQIDGPGYESAGSIQAMENDLRRILKLDLVADRPPTERRLFTH
ncbi:hypothetical protein TASIC1_0018003500 [Trichoderma asperellum]|uniref:Proteophosphoglycan 5 n=1 Tax=Trichoderma asperellum TaxID=101201 RepID=A0A6V8R738_TRIAP|nr:hypothetical protein TASIC1_0018003500 [Trichoderma asperellum]